MKLLLFAGTTEGRLLVEELSRFPDLEIAVCVATEYGREQLDESAQHLTVRTERLTEAEMERLMLKKAFDLVVDATHPYATQVTSNIQAATKVAKLPYIRLLREQSKAGNCRCFAGVQDAADALCETSGNVLIATGSKELKTYTRIPNYTERLFVRVLPTVESLSKCEELGFMHSHIVAMQGPFSQDLNRALMKQLDIKWMVTKDGGDLGGFTEKIQAAAELGVEVLVVDRPIQESGASLEQVVAEVAKRARERT